MPIYKYKAKRKDGTSYQESGEFLTASEIYEKIRNEGGEVLSVEEKNKNMGHFKMSFFSLRGIKQQEKITFAKNLSTMIDSGLSVSRALLILEKQTKNKKFKKVISEVGESINKGKVLSEALGNYTKIFSKLFIAMVKAGEETGNISESLKVVSSQLEKSHALIRKVKGAMIYPIIVISIMAVISVLMLVFMVPTLTETFVGLNIKLPLSTRILIAISEFLRNNIIMVTSGVLLFFGLFSIAVKTSKGQRFFDFLFLHTPLVSKMDREVNSARTARTLSSLISSGVDIVQSIEVTKEVLQNSYYKKVLEEAAISIKSGRTVSEVFASYPHLYPVFVPEMINVGEETGKIGEMFGEIAKYYEEEVDQKTKNLSTIIEPFLMVFIGIAVAFFALSMLAPTYSLVDAIGV